MRRRCAAFLLALSPSSCGGSGGGGGGGSDCWRLSPNQDMCYDTAQRLISSVLVRSVCGVTVVFICRRQALAPVQLHIYLRAHQILRRSTARIQLLIGLID